MMDTPSYGLQETRIAGKEVRGVYSGRARSFVWGSAAREQGDRTRMPDWSYQTLFRPLLFRLSPIRARTITLGAMGALAALPGGGKVIELFGDTQPPASIRQSLW